MREQVSLAEHTTLGVGGAAWYFETVDGLDQLREALRYAKRAQLEVLILGGGSNLLVADAGFEGLVIRQVGGEIASRSDGPGTLVRVDASVCWDDLVRWSVERGLNGIECLSGIPGDVGAAPIQNIGAYGQELRDTLRAVYVIDRVSGSMRRFGASECGFGYRTSRFKNLWAGRYVVTGIDLNLREGAPARLRYQQLRDRFDTDRPKPAEVRETVLAIRRSKSMVLDPEDDNRRSAGSFFMNPILGAGGLPAVRARLSKSGIDHEEMPVYRLPGGDIKLSAAWLIERCGYTRGHVCGGAGLSSNHCLALINRGEATAADIVALAREIRRAVQAKADVCLSAEPTFAGFSQSAVALLS